ncbi:MFS transporter [Corynebacterium sp. TAE3-ERU12]|uniref:MFS transporter n=1 Tax=Corynebacterium sp. TAE3-ERU12 TaxID=2849491 RepID=UPI001C457788|nr:MFS transporter [Corynebacterium sp. TAE3-ERU12]MBV7295825.1 MFS transporter [Corynebacterium sp. TAE3-ERU12]
MRTDASSTGTADTARTSSPPLLLMATATGLCAGGNYVNQPLLAEFSATFGVSPSAAATTVTVAQVAYAIGLFVVVPLGDKLERRGLVVALMGLTAAGHLIAGVAPGFAALVVGIAVAGFFSVAAQVLVPFASMLADPKDSGSAVGTVMSGLLGGILLSRTASGMLADAFGWHSSYLVTAAMLVACAVALWRVLPRSRVEQPESYLRTMRQTVRLCIRHRQLRMRSVIAAIAFAGFSGVFATMTPLLAGPPFSMSAGMIGVLGLLGLAGVFVATPAGRLVDRGYVGMATAAGIGLLALGWLCFSFAATSLAWFIAGFILVDVGLQLVHIVSMNVVYALAPTQRSTANSVYMTCYFAGAAGGSAIGVAAWAANGWAGVVVAGWCAVGLVAALGAVEALLYRGRV